MSSNCDSEGVPVDHDGHRMEDFISHTAPFAVRADVFQEVFSGYGKDVDGSHLEAMPMSGMQPSSSGGIALEDVVIVEDDYSSDENPPQLDGESNMSATVQAILRTTKHEREALISTKSKLTDVLRFLRKKGFSEAQIYEDLACDGFAHTILARNEFGLPDSSSLKQGDLKNELPKCAGEVLGNVPHSNSVVNGSPLVAQDPFKDKMKQKADGSSHVADTMLHGDGPVSGADNTPKPSWSAVVKNNITDEVISFDYCPMAPGASMVTPPSDVLKKGVEKFKYCLVGSFSKGTLNFSKVMEIAKKAWDSRGLCSISQKDSHTVLFKFNTERDMNAILARGTWYFDRKPLILTAWGTDLGVGKVTSIPLWVKFKNIPDYYWTREGLSCIASSVGPPICADKVTSQLNPVQFAKLCVKYTVGDPLPESVKVALMDVNTMELSKNEFATVELSYPQRPLVCSGCKSVGHLVGACPTVKRIWVKKPQVKNMDVKPSSDKKEPSTNPPAQDCPDHNEEHLACVNEPVAQAIANSGPSKGATVEPAGNNEEWTTVGGKKLKGDPSHSTVTAQQMPIYAAISKSLSKSQLKKAKKSGGKSSPKTK